MCGEQFGCHCWRVGGDVTGIKWEESRDTAQHPTVRMTLRPEVDSHLHKTKAILDEESLKIAEIFQEINNI